MALRDPIAAYNAASNVEAHMLCDRLNASGIEAFVIEDVSQVGTYGFGLLPEIHKPQVWVERNDSERAAVILAQYEDRNRELQGEVAAVAWVAVTCEECGARLAFPGTQQGSVQQCPSCAAYVDVEPSEALTSGVAENDNPYRSPEAAQDAMPSAGPAKETPTVEQFRLAALVCLASWIVGYAPSFGFWQEESLFSDARQWNTAGAVVPWQLINGYWYASNIAVIAGVAGMACFSRTARTCFTAYTLASVPLSALFGLAVWSPVENLSWTLSAFLQAWLITVSFWSPLARRFQRL